MTTYYIAGPMRGYPRFNFDAFDEAEANLKSQGFNVISPATMDRDLGFDPDRSTLDGFDMNAAVRRDVEAIIVADGVVLLPGHENSTGATAERHIAHWLRKPVYTYPDMEPYERHKP